MKKPESNRTGWMIQSINTIQMRFEIPKIPIEYTFHLNMEDLEHIYISLCMLYILHKCIPQRAEIQYLSIYRIKQENLSCNI